MHKKTPGKGIPFPGVFLRNLSLRIVHGLDGGIGQGLNLGVLDQLLGADGSTQATVVTLGVIDNSQIVGNSDRTVGADLLTQTAADAADGTATGSDSALCHGVTSNDHITVGLHGNDQATGADCGTGHTANAQILVNPGNALEDLDGAVLTGLGAGAVAQTAVLAGQGAVAADLGSSQAVMEAFVVTLGLGTGNLVRGVKSKATYEGFRDCIAASKVGGNGPISCKYGCLGFGTCVKACKYDAISVVNGVAKVNEDRCVGCMACSNVCPRQLIVPVEPHRNVVIACNSMAKGAVTTRSCTIGCIGCGLCKKICPEGAITVTNNLAIIDYSKCTNCGLCATVCPKHLIKDSNVEHLPDPSVVVSMNGPAIK